jgi:hypothetical protein
MDANDIDAFLKTFPGYIPPIAEVHEYIEKHPDVSPGRAVDRLIAMQRVRDTPAYRDAKDRWEREYIEEARRQGGNSLNF